jgi:hypothetical protein
MDSDHWPSEQVLPEAYSRKAPAKGCLGCAPIIVAFSAFPGLHVGCGRWYLTSFPNCGCDACAETAEGEGEKLRSLVGNVVAGRFRETICIPASGDPWTESEFWSEKRSAFRAGELSHELSRSRLDRAQAEQLVAESGRTSYEWRGGGGSDKSSPETFYYDDLFLKGGFAAIPQ